MRTCCLSVLLGPIFTASAAPRAIELTYSVTLDGQEPGTYDVFIPVPPNNEQQQVSNLKITSSIEGIQAVEPVFSNRFWHGQVRNPNGPITVTLRALIHRKTHRANLNEATAGPLSITERKTHAQWLLESPLVPVGADVAVLTPILSELSSSQQNASIPDQARGIYDWVIDNVEYKKTGTGWGNGDTFWACNRRYGNCTDFHSILLSLARTSGIPGRFEMGFPIPSDPPAGAVAGYHCWVELWLPGAGWIPIDASEAFNYPERRNELFGSHPADRILMSTGRHFRLGEGHSGAALNYFVYPYAERDGAPIKEGLELAVSYAAGDSK